MKKVLYIFMLMICFVSQIEAQQTKNVILDQRLSNNDTISTLRKWEGTFFTPSPYISPGTSFNFIINSNQVIQGNQNIHSNEKYNNWNSSQVDVANHHKFTILSTTNTLVSNFKPTSNGISIKNQFNEYSNLNGCNIYFKDPWLIDYPDSAYAYTKRNRGMDLEGSDKLDYKLRVSNPFYPDYATNYNGDIYKGVFLSQSFFGINSYYSVKAIDGQQFRFFNTGSTSGRYHKIYFQKWETSIIGGITYKYADSLETPLIFHIPNVTAQAQFKISCLSNFDSSFTKGYQRKIARNNLGRLFMTYESMGKIWLESSTDNGANWIVLNGGKPLTGEGRCPSITIYDSPSITQYGHYVIITYQEPQGISVDVYNDYLPQIPNQQLTCYGLMDITITGSSNYMLNPTTSLNPTLNSPGTGHMQIVFENNGVIKTFNAACIEIGSSDYNNWHLGSSTNPNDPSKYFTFTSNGTTPTLETYDNFYYLVYSATTNDSLVLCKFHRDSNNQITVDILKNVTLNSGYSKHEAPSLVVLSDAYARICWRGTRSYLPPHDPNNQQDNPVIEHRVVFRGQNNDTHFWAFGQNVSHPNINKSLNGTPYYSFTWAQSDNLTYFADNTLSTIRQLTNMPGRDIQVTSGNTKNDMYAEVFNANSTPYYFKTSNSIGSYYGLQKIDSYAFASGREGVISKDFAQFYFTVGDILVDNEKISFVEIPDTVSFNSNEVLNHYLESKPFQLNDNSTFLYSIQYGITDSNATAALLSNTDNYVSFKLQLIDKQTSEVLGIFDQVTFNNSNLYRYNNLSYSVNTAGIGNRQVFLRLVVDNNLNPNYSLGEIFATNNILEKTSKVITSFAGLKPVTEYGLDQNYPNPFNPNTTIRYQLPETGLVTLKIYDILGAEIATLVNEVKTTGKYEVNFNASQLASGVYLYKLQAGDFVQTKKMVLTK